MNSFLRQRNTPRRMGRQTWILCIVLGVVMIGGVLHLTTDTALSRPLHTLAAPLWYVGGEIETVATEHITLLKSKKALVLENRALSRALYTSREEMRVLALLQEENARLRTLLGRTDAPEGILAAVLVAPGASLYDTLVIDIGSEHGISKGDRVAAYGETVIGEIRDVYARTALVVLFSSPGTETTVLVGPSQIRTRAVGRGGGNFKATLPREAGVAPLDPIVIPGLGPSIFAVVEQVIEHPTDPLETILFKNPVNLNELPYVRVIRAQTIEP